MNEFMNSATLMEEYRKIPFGKIKDIGSYAVSMLKKGYVITKVLVRESDHHIIELISYADGKKFASYFCCYGSELVAIERMEPMFVKYGEKTFGDIYNASQDIVNYEIFVTIQSHHRY